MVKPRLRRMGSANKPFYRLIATDSRSGTQGRFLETLGWYDPKQEGVNFKLKLDRIDYWLSVGAQVSDTASSLIKKMRKMPAPAALKIEEAPVVVEEAAPVAVETEEA